MRPHFEDVRPQSEDAPAISQPLRVIAPPIYRWKGNGVTFQMSYQTPPTEKDFLSCSRAELLIRADGPLTVRSGRHRCALEDGRWCSPLPPRLPDGSYLQCHAGGELTKSRHMCAPPCISWRLDHNFTDGRDSVWSISLKCLASEMLPSIEHRSRFRLIMSAVLVQRMLPGSPHTGLVWALLTPILRYRI